MEPIEQYEKDAYFELRDKLIKRLPEPEKSIYGHFRTVEKSNMAKHGKLVINGVTPAEATAEHFMMGVDEVKKICLNALKEINTIIKDY